MNSAMKSAMKLESALPMSESEATRTAFDVEVFFDGDCPLCMREIRLLRRFDRRHRIRFTDIASDDFSADAVGRTHAELMARIHGRLPDGEWIEGVEVFRQLYSAIGMRWLVVPTRWWGIRQGLDALYRGFAKNRLKWTGRCGDDGSCSLD